MVDWSVVTVSYNSEKALRRNWGHQADRDKFFWIVVDNGSTDGSRSFAWENADLVIELPTNLGFSAANNIGLSRVTTPYVAFVNPDVRMGEAGWATTLASAIDDYGAIVAPQLLHPDGSPQPNARGLPYLAHKVLHRLAPLSPEARRYAPPAPDAPTYCSWLMGAAVCARRDVFNDIGGWNDDYFLYYEDHELGLRAWDHNLPVVVVPSARWTHEWARETRTLKLPAWRNELRSMRTFYRAYPEYLWGQRLTSASRAAQSHRMRDLLWSRAQPVR